MTTTGRILDVRTIALWWLTALLMTSGCASGPRYMPPNLPLPSTYREEMPEDAVMGPSQPQDHASRAGWWLVFGDPQLNALQARLVAGSPTLAQAEAALRVAQAVVRQERGALFPSVTASASGIRARSAAARGSAAAGAIATNGTVTTYSLDTTVAWEPDLWGRIRQSVAGGRASAEAAAADVESARLSSSAELAADYFQLRAIDADLALLDQTIEAYQRAATLTQNQYDAGIVSRSDVEQANTQLASAQAQAIEVRLQRAQFEHAIAVLVGALPAEFSLSAMPLSGDPPGIPVAIPSRVLEQRPDIGAAERRVAVANAQMGVASAAFFPTATLGGSGGFQATQWQQWLSWPMRVWSVGPALALTLFDGGARRAAKAEAAATYDETVAVYRETVLAAFQDVEDNLAAQRLLRQEAERQAVAVAAAQRSLDISMNQYRAGTVSYLQVATQQTTLLTNQRTAVSLAGRRFAAAVQLIRALGGPWDAQQLPVEGK
jgi:NodT family efflux transporter outer membrane factor (OMF) lipoprotein